MKSIEDCIGQTRLLDTQLNLALRQNALLQQINMATVLALLRPTLDIGCLIRYIATQMLA
jgi:hypothetical protein